MDESQIGKFKEAAHELEADEREQRRVSRRKLELIRWALAAGAFACPLVLLLRPGYSEGGWGALLFFLFVILGIPAAMLSLHLHPPKWLSRKPPTG